MKVGPLAPLCFSHAKTCRPTRRSNKQEKCAVLGRNTAHFGSKVCGSLGWNFACRQNQTVLTRNRAFLANLANERGGGALCPTFSCEKLGGARVAPLTSGIRARAGKLVPGWQAQSPGYGMVDFLRVFAVVRTCGFSESLLVPCWRVLLISEF